MKTNQIIIILAILGVTVVGLFFILSGKNTSTTHSNNSNTSNPVQDESQPHEH